MLQRETWLCLPRLFTVKHPDKTVQTKGRQCLCSGCVQRSGFPWRCISQCRGEAWWKARPAQDSHGMQVAQIRSNWCQIRTDFAQQQISISYLINSKALPTPLRIQNPHCAYQAGGVWSLLPWPPLLQPHRAHSGLGASARCYSLCLNALYKAVPSPIRSLH